MQVRPVTLLALAALVVSLPATPAGAQDSASSPRLVLQITVDQLRGDLPTRYYDRLGKGGFRYLWEHGAVFADAHHAHANTETIVGHATLATGAHPAAHGMIANTWLDRKSERVVYNIEDARYRLLTTGADVDQQTEIDPTQRAARSEGRSPSAIMVTTFGDELAVHTGGRAKVFATSVKDRGAVSMAGHAGKAFWFSKASGDFVTSDYYYDRYPDWVNAWNSERRVDAVAVERVVADEIEKLPGVALAVSSHALRADALPDTPLYRAVLNNFNPMRSGDIFVVFEPNRFIADFDGLTVASTHGSPWRYDTFVPIVFAGPRIPAQHVYRRVHTVDVAPSLAAWLGVKRPSGAVGEPLEELFREPAAE